MEPKPSPNAPFPEPLERLNVESNDTLEYIPSRPDLIIRQDESDRDGYELSDSESLIAEYSILRKAFEKLASYGVRVLPFSPVVGHGEGKEKITAYVVTDRVDGIVLTSAWEELDAAAIKDLDSTFAGLYHYYTDIVNSREGVSLFDITARQFMYGHTAKDPDNHIYLVDLSNVYTRWEAESHYEPHEQDYLLEDVREAEEKTGYRMLEARLAYKELVAALISAGVRSEQWAAANEL